MNLLFLCIFKTYINFRINCSMICFLVLMQMIWIFGKKSVNGKILTMTSQRNIFSPIPIPISSPNRCRPTAPDTISGLTKLDISV